MNHIDEKRTNRETNISKPNGIMAMAEEMDKREELSYLPLTGIEKIQKIPEPILKSLEHKKLDYVEIKKFDEEIHISFFEKNYYYVNLFWRVLKIVVPILPHIIRIYGLYSKNKNKIKENNMFKDPKTTLIGIIGAIAILIKVIFKIEVPQEVQDSFVAIIVFLLGLFSSDSSKTN
ncbi:MAG: hypothetical protein GYA62_13940 [Bacteroidales bacterium]|nr:hypothetical protein [Bacteroidales bacterium]